MTKTNNELDHALSVLAALKPADLKMLQQMQSTVYWLEPEMVQVRITKDKIWINVDGVCVMTRGPHCNGAGRVPGSPAPRTTPTISLPPIYSPE